MKKNNQIQIMAAIAVLVFCAGLAVSVQMPGDIFAAEPKKTETVNWRHESDMGMRRADAMDLRYTKKETRENADTEDIKELPVPECVKEDPVIPEGEPEWYACGEIPAVYCGMPVGYIWDTAYGIRDDWCPQSPQAQVQAIWEEYGGISDEILTIDGMYLIACKDCFGNVGDWITFCFEDGMSIECLMYDEKGDEWNSTMFGHIDGDGYNIKVLEFYMRDPYYPIPFMSCSNRVCGYENHGKYLDVGW